MGYREIADHITARIAAREWPRGAALPFTQVFAEYYGVSKATINNAFALLVDRNIVRSAGGGRRFVP